MNLEEYKKRNPIGTKVKAKVLSVQPYGVFIELAKGIDGLVKVPEILFEGESSFPQDYPQVGETIDSWIIWYDEEGRISLTQKPENHKKLKENR